MAETLLYPKKLTQAPELYINPAALFGGVALSNGDTNAVSLIDNQMIQGEALVRYLDLSYANFPEIDLKLGILMPIDQQRTMGLLSLPFQNVGTPSVEKYICHGWSYKNAVVTSNPTESVDKQVLENPAVVEVLHVEAAGGEDQGNSGRLFHMFGTDLEDGGLGDQFISIGTWSVLEHQTSPGFFPLLGTEFQKMFDAYNATGTLAIEIVVSIPVIGGEGSNGFAAWAGIF